MTIKYIPIPKQMFTSQYQRHIGNISGHLKQRKIPPDVDLLAMRKVMTVKEMAIELGCSKNCVYRWLREGVLRNG